MVRGGKALGGEGGREGILLLHWQAATSLTPPPPPHTHTHRINVETVVTHTAHTHCPHGNPRRKLSDADKDILLADLTQLLIQGAISRDLAGWLFGPEGPAVFDGWRYSDVPLIVAGHAERSMLAPGEQAEGSGGTGLAQAALSLLDFLHGLGFKGADNGRTLLIAVGWWLGRWRSAARGEGRQDNTCMRHAA